MRRVADEQTASIKEFRSKLAHKGKRLANHGSVRSTVSRGERSGEGRAPLPVKNVNLGNRMSEYSGHAYEPKGRRPQHFQAAMNMTTSSNASHAIPHVNERRTGGPASGTPGDNEYDTDQQTVPFMSDARRGLLDSIQGKANNIQALWTKKPARIGAGLRVDTKQNLSVQAPSYMASDNDAALQSAEFIADEVTPKNQYGKFSSQA